MKKILIIITIFLLLVSLSSCKGADRKPYETYSYGEYPQDRVVNTNIIDELDKLTSQDVDDKGYFNLNGKKYLKAYTELDGKTAYFNDGTKVLNDKYYYFEVSKISWRVLNKNDNELSLISEYILDNEYYTETDNLLYSSSQIRKFLLDEFYNRAFYLEENKPLTKTIISSTISGSDKETLRDKIWIPDAFELENKDNGFYSSDDRYAFVTDYAKAMGVDYCKEGSTSYFNNAATYPTRTLSINSKALFYYDFYGDSKLTKENTTLDKFGVRPCISLTK